MGEIIVEKVSKVFRIGFKKNQGALARTISFLSGREPKKNVIALNSVSFKAGPGEIIGIIGENASGKSTILRAIAGIYNIDSGVIKTRGKIISLINLYIGLKERLNMEDNIYLCCSFFGLDRKTTKERFDSIVEFAELWEYINTKIYQFSEGMKQRLAFSIAIHCDPDILLIDEDFEVGDEEFRKKSTDRIKELVKEGVTILLVSHDMDLIKKCCDKVVWMNKGRIIKGEDNKEIIKGYLKSHPHT